jgi:hypothetical protein
MENRDDHIHTMDYIIKERVVENIPLGFWKIETIQGEIIYVYHQFIVDI